jgi:hypothetical protein
MKFKILFGCMAMGMLPLAAGAQNRVLSTDLTNIAAASSGGRVVSVTSTFDNNKIYAGQNLIDGKVWNGTNANSRGWVSDKYDPIDMDSVTLGFAGNRIYRIGRIVINPANDQTPERWAKDIEIQTSVETAEGPWNPVAQLSLTQSPTPQTFDMLPAPARFVRVVVRTNYGSDRAVALGEVEIYESIGDSDPVGALITRFEGALNELKGYRKERMENSVIPTSGGTAPTPNVRDVQLAAAGISTGKTNIAATKNGGKVLAFSSMYNNDAAFGPEKLIDGENYREADNKGSNGWASNSFEPGKEYVTLGFAKDATKVIDRFIINPASNQSDLRWARRMDVQVTTGNFKDGPWKDITTINLKPQAVNQEFSFRPVEAKYVRFIFRANGPGFVLPGGDPNINSDRAVSLGEIEIYESATPDDKLDSVISRLNQVLVEMKTLRRTQINAELAPATPTSVTAPAAPEPVVAPVVAPAKPETPVRPVSVAKPAVKPTGKPATKIAPPKSVREATAPKKTQPSEG